MSSTCFLSSWYQTLSTWKFCLIFYLSSILHTVSDSELKIDLPYFCPSVMGSLTSYKPRVCICAGLFTNIKQLVDFLEQNIGCWRQAFIQPTAGHHQVWGKTEMLYLIWTLRVRMLRTCEKLHRGVGLA